MSQGPQRGIEGPRMATPGASIQVLVKDGSTEVEVDLVGGNNPQKFPVAPDGTATVPIPPGSSGQILYVVTRRRPIPSVLRVEIVATP